MRYFATIALLLMFSVSLAFSASIKGVIKDAETKSPLIGANIVLLGTSMGSTTDEDGFFMIQDVPEGSYKLEVSYLGYQQYEQMVTLSGNDVSLEIELTPVSLVGEAINIVASRAKIRETPVAFTNVEKEEIQRNLGSRDIPLVLNTTPGIYATAQGGGAGDARINVRGFNQRNVAVLINGVPVNDMENGWVYWSNWDGLGDVTSSIQVQRGLGASNLAIASVGGTLNILTDPAALKSGIKYKQEIGSGNFLKETIALNTGLMDNGLAVTAAFVRKTGNGIADQTWTDAWAYFGAISYTLSKNHQIELYAIGAPQKHGQRLYTQNIEKFDTDYALKIYEQDNLPQSVIDGAADGPNYGRNFNPNWGPIFNYDPNDLKEYYNGGEHSFTERSIYMDGDKISDGTVLMERENYYHKPQINLNWHWKMSDKALLSNVAYVSIGRGGGTGLKGWPGTISGSRDPNAPDYNQFAGQLNFQGAYDFNKQNIDTDWSDTENRSTVVVRNSVNRHNWYGLLSTLDYRLNETVKLTTGIDLRSYKGEHYRTVRNLLGGDYYLDFDNENQDTPMKRLGDRIDYNNDGYTRWYGGFAQIEGRMSDLTVVATGSFSTTGYKRTDYFVDPEAHLQPGSKILPTESAWQNFTGGTAKIGANLNVSPEWNLYGNVGFISKAPIFDAVFDFSHQLYEQIFNEKVYALELGSGYRTSHANANINFYYTRWNDRSWPRSVSTGNSTTYFLLQGIDARHAGVEIDYNYKPNRWISFRTMATISEWVWLNDVETTFAPEDDPTNLTTFNIYTAGLKVGDAAQKSFSFATTLYPVKGLYINGTFSTFGDHFADFDPSFRTDPNDRRQPWRLPNYSLVDLHFGYTLPFNPIGNVKLELFGHVFNLFDTKYITDADDRGNHTAADARVYFGLERRFNAGLNIEL